jgi:hypothetical protein
MNRVLGFWDIPKLDLFTSSFGFKEFSWIAAPSFLRLAMTMEGVRKPTYARTWLHIELTKSS